jgi:ABC-2 type transport system permease protein
MTLKCSKRLAFGKPSGRSTFVFPAWLPRVTLAVPTRWAVDGFDAMTWRGVGASGAVMPVLVMLGFAAMFALVAVRRFRWEES